MGVGAWSIQEVIQGRIEQKPSKKLQKTAESYCLLCIHLFLAPCPPLPAPSRCPRHSPVHRLPRRRYLARAVSFPGRRGGAGEQAEPRRPAQCSILGGRWGTGGGGCQGRGEVGERDGDEGEAGPGMCECVSLCLFFASKTNTPLSTAVSSHGGMMWE